MPTEIEGLRPGVPVARTVKIGTLSYSLAERNFTRGKQKIKILLFDYNNALIMYSQAIKNTGTVAHTPAIDSLQQPGNNFYHYHEIINENTCRISMGINGRFFVNISSEHVNVQLLRLVVAALNFSGLERTSVEEPKFR